MRVRIDHAWQRDGFDIWFWDNAGKYVATYNFVDGEPEGHWEQKPIEEAAVAKPSLFLPRQMLEELIRASEGHVHAQDATVRHLDDAVAIRDRFLALIEKRGLR